MQYEWKTVLCRPELTHNKEFKFLEVSLLPRDEIYINALAKAKELYTQMNIHAPDGSMRSNNTIFCNCFAGSLAELTVINRINNLAKYFKRKLQ